MTITTIRFTGGRGKRTTDVRIKDLSEGDDGCETIARAAKKALGLMSAGVDAAWNEDGQGGSIFVGMFRRVGEFTVLRETPAQQQRIEGLKP